MYYAPLSAIITSFFIVLLANNSVWIFQWIDSTLPLTITPLTEADSEKVHVSFSLKFQLLCRTYYCRQATLTVINHWYLMKRNWFYNHFLMECNCINIHGCVRKVIKVLKLYASRHRHFSDPRPKGLICNLPTRKYEYE